MLYELYTKWSVLNHFQMPKTDDTLQIMFATLPNTIVRDLTIERYESPSPGVIDLKKATCLSNESDFYSTLDSVNLAKGAGKG